MHPLEFQGLNGYCRSVFWNSKKQDFLGFFTKQLLCSTLALIHIRKCIEPDFIANNGILSSPSIVGRILKKIL